MRFSHKTVVASYQLTLNKSETVFMMHFLSAIYCTLEKCDARVTKTGLHTDIDNHEEQNVDVTICMSYV